MLILMSYDLCTHTTAYLWLISYTHTHTHTYVRISNGKQSDKYALLALVYKYNS